MLVADEADVGFEPAQIWLDDSLNEPPHGARWALGNTPSDQGQPGSHDQPPPDALPGPPLRQRHLGPKEQPT